MSEDPQFRTVLRGLDPDQVRAALGDMQTSVVTARRVAADRTIELTRMQERVTQLQRDLDASRQRVVALQQEGEANGPQGAPTAGDVGARIAAILALANEEADELRAKGRDEAQRRLDAADAAIGESRAEMETYADGVRDDARTEATEIVEAARRSAAELLSRAEQDADARRAEGEAVAVAHQAQAAALVAFGQQVGLHAERLKQAQARVEQLANDEAALVERQGAENAERIRRDTQNQLAAVDARREGITAQLTTISTLLHELGQAVGTDDGPEPMVDEAGASVPETSASAEAPDAGGPSTRPADAPEHPAAVQRHETAARR